MENELYVTQRKTKWRIAQMPLDCNSRLIQNMTERDSWTNNFAQYLSRFAERRTVKMTQAYILLLYSIRYLFPLAYCRYRYRETS